MRLSACITTRNRTQELNACLRALWDSQVKPHAVVVSDASPEREVQQKNRQIVERYPRRSRSALRRNLTIQILISQPIQTSSFYRSILHSYDGFSIKARFSQSVA